MANIINISLQPKQLKALQLIEAGQKNVFYGGAKGGGKSYLIRAKEVFRRMKYPGTTGAIFRQTYPELLANHIRKFFQEYPVTRDWYKAQDKSIYWPNGSVTDFKYLQRTDDVYKQQGIEYDDITLDEATQHEEEVYKILSTSLRNDPKIFKMNPGFRPSFLMTGNPGGIGHHWVKRLFVDKEYDPNEKPGDYAFIQAKVYDNQVFLKVNPDYLATLQALPEDIRRAYLDGDWDVFIGQFFRSWRRDIHVIEPFKIDSEWPKVFSLDWGYFPHPFHVGWYAKDFQGNIYKYREKSGLETSPPDLGEIIAELSKSDRNLRFGVGDTQMWQLNPWSRSRGEVPSDKSIAMQINAKLAELKIHMFKANKDRVTGWANLRSLLEWRADYKANGTREFKQRPRYYVFENCTETISAYPRQIHSELRPEDMLKQDGDDPCDTDRYAIMALVKGVKQVTEPKTRTAKLLRLARKGSKEYL